MPWRFEMISTASCLTLSAAFLVITILRVRNSFVRNDARVPVRSQRVGTWTRAGKLVLPLSLLLLVPAVTYFLFVIPLPKEPVRDSAKTLCFVLFTAWALVEFSLCYSVPVKLLEGSLLRRLSFFGGVTSSLIVAGWLFSLIPRSLPYPREADCVILELPVRGEWRARHAGASKITNGHHLNYPYAIDILKLGPDGQLRKGMDQDVTDYYSYDAPVYAPADGRVVQVVDGLAGERIGNHVVIDVGKETYVFLVHFRNGSIVVKKGQFVYAGALIGRVGNSGGASGILHLHMHVQNKAGWAADGRVTYPFRFRQMHRKRLLFWSEVTDGYLLRNDRFTD